MHDNHHLQSTVAYQNTGQTVLSRRATALLRLRRIRYQVHTKYIYIFMQMRAHHRYSCTWTCSWYYDFWSYTCTGTGSTIWLLCIARIVSRNQNWKPSTEYMVQMHQKCTISAFGLYAPSFLPLNSHPAHFVSHSATILRTARQYELDCTVLYARVPQYCRWWLSCDFDYYTNVSNDVMCAHCINM